MTAKGLSGLIFPLLFTGFIFWLGGGFRRQNVNVRERAEFAVLFTKSREALDLFSKCPHINPASDNDRMAVQQRFSGLRKKVANSPFQDELKVVDMEQQILAEDKMGMTDALVCRRLKPFAPIDRVRVDQAIGRVESFLAAH